MHALVLDTAEDINERIISTYVNLRIGLEHHLIIAVIIQSIDSIVIYKCTIVMKL